VIVQETVKTCDDTTLGFPLPVQAITTATKQLIRKLGTYSGKYKHDLQVF